MANETHRTRPSPGRTATAVGTDAGAPASGDGAARGTWHEREIATALQRLATARANLSGLEEAQAAAGPLGDVDEDTRSRLSALDAEIRSLVPLSVGRKGRHARARIDELSRELDAAASLAGLGDAERYRTARATFDVAGGGVDPTVLAFARREAEAAEAAFLEITSLVLPEPEPVPEDGPVDHVEDDDAEDGRGELFGMRLHPPAAS
jgi:hypothetical protein